MGTDVRQDLAACLPNNGPMTSIYNRIAGESLERIAAISDGLFAFAMTVIVLDIHVPEPKEIHTEHRLGLALIHLLPRAATYLLSFMTLGIFWVGQQTQLNQFTKADRQLTWLHLCFLAAVAVLPFSTALLAAFTTFRTALILYWLNILMLGIMPYASWTYAERAKLVKKPEIGDAVRRRIVHAQLLYAIGASLCIVSTYWSMAFIILVQINYAVAPRIKGLERLTG